MAISLKKGGSFNLTKKEPSLQRIMIGLGWEMKPGNNVDLDASVFMVGANTKLPSDDFFVFYNNLKSPDGAVEHTGDNRTGAGDGDDEMILANLPKIDANIHELIVAVTIHDADTRKHHFGLLQDAYIRVVDVDTKRVILQYDLDEDFGGSTDVEFGRLKRENGEWLFLAIGEGQVGGLQGFVDKYA